MNEPTFDAGGYPTDETLEAITNWDCLDMTGLFTFVREAWSNYGRFEEDPVGTIHCTTGGWSGNESLIDALAANFCAWHLCWVQSNRGGAYIFKIRELTDSPNYKAKEAKDE